MSAAIKDVLNFASLSRKDVFSHLDLNYIMAIVLSDLELVISEKDAKINRDTLPVVQGIPLQMHMLMYNLLNNALKFSKPGEKPLINIECKTLSLPELVDGSTEQKAKDIYEITVQDNGIGFESNLAEKIFVMFQRLHSSETFEGTGVGLAICKKVVLNHGGKIWAESTLGQGAKFKIHLPVGIKQKL
jgi:two-component system CheB/CheR fusion protein